MLARGFGRPQAGAAQLEPRSPDPASVTAVSGCGMAGDVAGDAAGDAAGDVAGDVAGDAASCLSLGGHRAEAADAKSVM